MTTVTLKARVGVNLPPLLVTTDRNRWPAIVGSGAALHKFHGIGELRALGYDVQPIAGHGTVCEA